MYFQRPHLSVLVAPALILTGLTTAPERPSTAVDGWVLVSTSKSTDRGSGESTMSVQVAAPNVRVDWIKAPPGMSPGSYMIIHAESASVKLVSPREKSVTIVPLGGLASMLASTGAAGIMKIELSDVVVTTSEAAAGEQMLGFATKKYTMREAYSMKMSMGPIKRSSTVDNTTEMWMAEVPPADQKAFEAFAKNLSQNFSGVGFGGEGMKALLDEVATKMPKGVMLKSIATSTTTDGGRKSTGTTTTEVKEFRQAAIDPKVFEVPANFKVNDMSALMNRK